MSSANIQGVLHVPRRKNIMREFTLHEISAVDRPAQEAAKMTIMKRDGGGVSKATKTEDGKSYPASDYAYVPDASAPSTWKLRLTSTPGGDPDPGIVGAACAALGPTGYRGNRVQLPAGDRAKVVARVRAAWHKANPGKQDSEMPDGIAKSAEELGVEKESDMPDDTKELEKKVGDLTAELTKATEATKAATAKIAELEAANKAMIEEAEMAKAKAKMSQAEQDMMDQEEAAEKEPAKKAEVRKRLLAMSPADRLKLIAAKAASDETVTINGREVKKSVVGEDTFAVLKSQADDITKLQKANADERERRETAELTKRADDEYAHLPGTTAEKVSVLKAAGALDKTVQEALNKMLTAGEKAIQGAFSKMGHGGGKPSDGGEFEKRVAEIRKRDNSSRTDALEAARKEYPAEFAAYQQAQN